MLVLVVTLAAVVVLGLLWRVRQGRLRPVAPAAHAGRVGAVQPAWAELGIVLGARGTLLQFSTAFCQPCRATRRVLAGVAESLPGVVHVDVDAESHLDVVRNLGVASTPITLVLDATGRERFRATGVPRPAQVRAALDRLAVAYQTATETATETAEETAVVTPR